MGDRWGLIEWIDNLEPLKSLVNGYWEASGNYSINVSNIAKTELYTDTKHFFFFFFQ